MHPLISAAAGGALLGTGAGILLLGTGRVAGVSGVAGGVVRPVSGDLAWRLVFLACLMAGGWLGSLAVPAAIAWNNDTSVTRLVAAGLLIGAGARIANGCTSGHGVCGVSRGSHRSVIAVTLFTIAGIIAHWVDVRVWGGS
jgi:uncharacterized protein